MTTTMPLYKEAAWAILGPLPAHSAEPRDAGDGALQASGGVWQMAYSVRDKPTEVRSDGACGGGVRGRHRT